MAWHAVSSSMLRIDVRLASRGFSFSAAPIPMLTKSSLLPDVGIESTEAGCARILFSDASAAAVTCASMNPDSSPGEYARNGVRSEVRGFTMRSIRLSEMPPSCASAMAIRSSTVATGCP